MHYLVDGYNLMFALDRHEEDVAGSGSLEDRRDALVELLERFSRDSGRRLVVVFDGAGEFDWVERKTRVGPITVIFSHRTDDADTVIIRRIKASTAGRYLAVVSDDRRIRAAAGRGKATSVRCESFMNKMRRVFTEGGDVEPPEKFRGLSDQEARVWMRVMGFDDASEGTDVHDDGGAS